MNHFPLVALLLTACGESWTWHATSANKDSGGDTAAPGHDLDGDGFTDIAAGGDDCWDDPISIPAGFEAIAGTAQPAAAEVHPDATETWYDGVDQDCAGNDDFDRDFDGYNATNDCDDLDALVNPAAAEDCATAYDDDCDGDDNDVDSVGCAAWYSDTDGDGYGSAEACLCAATVTYALAGGDDCDDADAAVNPGEAEVCSDGVDNDCDGGAGACALTGGSLSGADAKFTGEADDIAGYSVAEAGDINGDGFDDFLVGAIGNGDGVAGSAYLLLGSAAPASGSLTGGVEFTGETAGDAAGYEVSSAGDIDGDGLGDFLVGAFKYGDGISGGVAYLILGEPSPGGGSLSSAVTYSGEGVGDLAGSAVSDAGDVNGDGLDDFVVGAPYNDDFDGNAGAAYLILGSATPSGGSLGYAVEYTAEAADNYAGVSVSGAGDVDGDGLDDFVVGADYNADGGGGAGAVYLILGVASPIGGSLSTAIQYTGEATSDRAGCSASGAGDVNGDGYGDVLVGARYSDDGGTDSGAAYLIAGTASPLSVSLTAAIEFSGEATNDNAGVSVSGAGDVDADGYDDVLIGAYGNADYRGAAYLVLGESAPASAQLSSAVRYSGENDPDYAGFSVSGAGDTNADGYHDLLIGGHGNDDGGSYAGAAYLILGQGL